MLTVKEMRKLERYASSRGILPIELMENAGKAASQALREKFDLNNKHIIIFAGPGNNAGDGFVTARYLAETNQVTVLFFGTVEKLTEESQKNYDKIKDNVSILQIKEKDELKQFHVQKDINLICVDALVGIGFKGELRDPIKFAIEYYNSLEGEKISIDIPSGLNADTGEGDLICKFDYLASKL